MERSEEMQRVTIYAFWVFPIFTGLIAPGDYPRMLRWWARPFCRVRWHVAP